MVLNKIIDDTIKKIGYDEVKDARFEIKNVYNNTNGKKEVLREVLTSFLFDKIEINDPFKDEKLLRRNLIIEKLELMGTLDESNIKQIVDNIMEQPLIRNKKEKE